MPALNIPTSQITTHPQQDLIDRWVLAGKPVRWIAAQANPPVSYGAVQRYRTHLIGPALKRVAAKLGSPAAVAVREDSQDARVNPFVKRTDALWSEAWSAVQDAKRAVTTVIDPAGNEQIRGRDFGVLAPIISAATRTLELYGKGTGYLQDAAPGATNVVIVLPSTAVMQQPADEGQVIEVVAEQVK